MDEDQIALSRLAHGDLHGLETLVEHHQVQAVYAAYMIVFDHGLAEDVAQTAFVRVAEKIHQYDQNRPFMPWFFRIVVNEALKVSRLQNRMVALDEEPDRYVSALADWLTDPQPLPETVLEAKETGQVILKALKRLTPQQRAVVVMRYYQEMSEAEMSAQMESPLSTVKWWLRSARERLRNLLRASRLFEDHDQESR
jgi:RNA polymerase sigma-70 factor (ECF subfamily)